MKKTLLGYRDNMRVVAETDRTLRRQLRDRDASSAIGMLKKLPITTGMLSANRASSRRLTINDRQPLPTNGLRSA